MKKRKYVHKSYPGKDRIAISNLELRGTDANPIITGYAIIRRGDGISVRYLAQGRAARKMLEAIPHKGFVANDNPKYTYRSNAQAERPNDARPFTYRWNGKDDVIITGLDDHD